MAKTFQITLYKIRLIQLYFKIPEKGKKSYCYYTQLIRIIKSLTRKPYGFMQSSFWVSQCHGLWWFVVVRGGLMSWFVVVCGGS